MDNTGRMARILALRPPLDSPAALAPEPGGAVQVSHLPVENGEGLQILHYVDGQKYEAHHDFFHDKYNALPSNGGQRIATVLMYL